MINAKWAQDRCVLLQELILLFAIIATYIAVRFARINTMQFPIGLEDQKDNADLSLEENQFDLASKAYFLQMLPCIRCL